jgi:Flp pilus assembly protein TadD
VIRVPVAKWEQTMAGRQKYQLGDKHWGTAKAVAMVLLSAQLGGCAGLGEVMPGLSADATNAPPITLAANADGSAASPETTQNDLQKATEYWGKKYSEKPTELENALSYAKNLRALGDKRQALVVLQQASTIHGANKELAAEYGKLALELEQLTVAQQMLALADNPTAPDWKVISARGTAEAKLGNYKEAINHYERALALKPGHPPLQSNLALALTMNGEAAKAEGLLRQASTSDASNIKVRQNLALVLGLQGKYDEATKIGSETLAADGAKSNTQMIRQMVKLEPKSLPASSTTSQVANASQPLAAPSFKPAMAVDSATAEAGGWAPKVASVAQSASVSAKATATGMAPTQIQADGVAFKPATR